MSMPTDEEITRAVRLGRVAGHTHIPVLEACPYPPDQPVLRWRFAQGYAETKADGWLAAAGEWLRKVWYGNEEDA